MNDVFFNSWEQLGRTGVTTVLAYLLLIVILRASGKRTLSKMNAFDFIVTIALGSTLATVILNKNVPLAEGILALFLLVFLQYLLTYTSTRSSAISKLVKSDPALVAYKGAFLKEAMLKERITEDEVYAVLRKKGYQSLEVADAVVLETDGSLSVIGKVDSLSAGALENIVRPTTEMDQD